MASDLDQDSPTARVHAYLASKGLQPTAQNVRNVLQAQAMGMPVFENMKVQQQSNDPGVGQSGSAAKKIESGPRGQYASPATERPSGPNGGLSSGYQTPDNQQTPNNSESKTSSAPPSSDMNVGGMIATGLGLGAAGAGGLYGASRYFGRDMPIGGDPAAAVPNFRMADQYGPLPLQQSPLEGQIIPPSAGDVAVPGAEPVGRGEFAPTGRVMDVDPTMIGNAGQRALPPPDQMSMSLDKAMQPAGAQLQIGASPNPADVLASQGLPPGITPVDAANVQLRTNPTGALPAAGRGAVSGGSPQVGNILDILRNSEVGRAIARTLGVVRR